MSKWMNQRLDFFFFFFISWQYVSAMQAKGNICLSLKAPGWKGFEAPPPNRQPCIHLILGTLQRRLLESSMALCSFGDPFFTSLCLVQIPVWHPGIFQNRRSVQINLYILFQIFCKKTTADNKNVLVSFKPRMDALLWIARCFYSSVLHSFRILPYWDNSASGLAGWNFSFFWQAVLICPLWLSVYIK